MRARSANSSRRACCAARSVHSGRGRVARLQCFQRLDPWRYTVQTATNGMRKRPGQGLALPDRQAPGQASRTINSLIRQCGVSRRSATASTALGRPSGLALAGGSCRLASRSQGGGWGEVPAAHLVGQRASLVKRCRREEMRGNKDQRLIKGGSSINALVPLLMERCSVELGASCAFQTLKHGHQRAQLRLLPLFSCTGSSLSRGRTLGQACSCTASLCTATAGTRECRLLAAE